MLPFLKPKTISSVIIGKTKPEGGIEDEGVEGEQDPGMVSAAEDMISAFNMKDAKALAEAFQAAFDICESMPRDESEPSLVDQGEAE